MVSGRPRLDHRKARADLAAAFRWAARLNLHEAVANHFSLAVDPAGTRFLMNPNQTRFSRIRASDLLELDANDPVTLSRPGAPDPTAWGLHGSLHRRCPHARCVMHVHSVFATVLASLEDSRLPPIDQNTATFYNRMIVDEDFAGLAFEAEGERCAALLADPKVRVVVMGNHGLLVIGDGMSRMREALRPGIAEQELRALMWQATIGHGGEWLDYRLLASGERTNPWQQEASSRTIRAGDPVVFDCGMVGPFSYGADVSRAFHCGPGRPSDEQRKLYTLAWNEVRHNTALLRAGASFRDFIADRFIQEPGYGDQPYPCLAHGVGMGDEWPVILHSSDHPDHYDGAFEAGMVICVESYVGEVGGVEGVKLEDQVLVTESGPIVLSRYPYEDSLLGREV